MTDNGMNGTCEATPDGGAPCGEPAIDCFDVLEAIPDDPHHERLLAERWLCSRHALELEVHSAHPDATIHIQAQTPPDDDE